jgi:hypothetical protein
MDTMRKLPFPPRGLLVPLATNSRLQRVPFCLSAPQARASASLTMSLRRLYDLDKSFPDRLDQILHDQEYVDELRGLPDHELSELVDHLNDVCLLLSQRPSSSIS